MLLEEVKPHNFDIDFCGYCEKYPNDGDPDPITNYSLDKKFTMYVCKFCLHKILEEHLERGQYEWSGSTHNEFTSVYDCNFCDAKTNRVGQMCKTCRFNRGSGGMFG